MSITELSVVIATIAIATSVSINAYNFSKESKYLKNKYKEKGYLEGYDQGFLDGMQFIESIIPEPTKKKKTLWERGKK